MADAVYVATNLTFSAATGAKTVLNVIAGANQPISLIQWGISMDGVTATAVPAVVELCQSTQATAGTSAGSVPTILQLTGRAVTIQPTAGHNYTAEPTALSIIEQYYVPQYMGGFVMQYPLGTEPETDLSGGTVKALAIRINTTATVNVRAYMRFSIGG
jgi:hypothetical protein